MQYLRTVLIGVWLAGALALAAGSAQAMGDNGDDNAANNNPDWVAARQAIDKNDFGTAVPLLRKVVGANPKHVDALNYLGYASARQGEHELALSAYRQALTLSPEHRGANEYLGELFLKLGDLKAAEERLKVLDGACFFGCAEYDALKKAIADYKASGGYKGTKIP